MKNIYVQPLAEHRIRAKYEDVVQRCADAVRYIRGVHSWNVDAARGVITASVGMSMLSWGEPVRLEIQPFAEDVLVRVSSTPKLPFTLVD